MDERHTIDQKFSGLKMVANSMDIFYTNSCCKSTKTSCEA